ncbi:MAG: SMC-Scp complex subunit ScpB [Planctomycetota bacterium]|jgi:segregation and condensation protein B
MIERQRITGSLITRTIAFRQVRNPGLGLRDASTTAAGWRWSFLLRRQTAGTSLQKTEDEQHPTRRSARMARLEAVLLVADGALTHRKLAQFATLADTTEAKSLIARLNAAYDRDGCAFRIEQVAGGFRLMTRPQFALWLDRLHNRQARTKLSPPMMETLSIVAYRQPVTRAEIEQIRGVQTSEMLKQLMDRGLVRITGEDDSLGRPFLYGTTRQFLEEFGLGRLDDLPMADTLRRVEEPVADAIETDAPIELSAENTAA